MEFKSFASFAFSFHLRNTKKLQWESTEPMALCSEKKGENGMEQDDIPRLKNQFTFTERTEERHLSLSAQVF